MVSIYECRSEKLSINKFAKRKKMYHFQLKSPDLIAVKIYLISTLEKPRFNLFPKNIAAIKCNQFSVGKNSVLFVSNDLHKLLKEIDI